MVEYYRGNRDAAVDRLKQAGIPVTYPKGAFYMLVNISSTGMPARDIALKLLNEEQVAVAPGNAFSSLADGYVRISFCTDRSTTVEEGMAGIVWLIDRLR